MKNENIFPTPRESQGQEARQIMPTDLKDLTGREPINIEFTISIKRDLKVPYPQKHVIHGQQFTEMVDQVQQNLTKFAVDWKRWPVPENYVDKAMDDVAKAIKAKLQEFSLMR